MLMSRKITKSIVYSLLFLCVFGRCAYNDSNIEVDCSVSDLAVVVVSTRDASSCKAIDGEITLSATGGVGPYDFNINDGQYQTNATFVDLGPGTHTVKVKDMNNCWRSAEVTIGAANSNLTASATTTSDGQCPGENGTITITATGGQAPYQYQLDSQGFGASNSFAGVSSGIHVILIKDNEDCQTTLSITVARSSSGISYVTTIKPILDVNCNVSGCHGTGTGARDWTNFENVKSHALNIKTRTSNRSMPPATTISQEQIDQIACWVDDGAPNN